MPPKPPKTNPDLRKLAASTSAPSPTPDGIATLPPPPRGGKTPAIPPQPWAFPARFRARAFSWKGAALASQRLKEALTEIKAVHRTDPIRAADGAIRLIERLVPAIQDIDSSSGALGTATHRALDVLLNIIATAPADDKTRAEWLDRLWQAYNDDGYGYLDQISVRWGELCASPGLAGRWADDLAPSLRSAFAERSQMRGGSAALSCLSVAGRHGEIIEIVALLQYEFWDYQRFAFQALVDIGRPEAALQYAESRSNPNDANQVAAACERVLLGLGRREVAYRGYGLRVHRASTNLASFRAVAKAYPEIPASKLLADLVAAAPGEEGKWFATAKELGLYVEAIEVANSSPCDPKTLIRAARDFEQSEPVFALKSGLTALRWLCAGHGYDLVGNEVDQAFDHAMRAADAAGCRDDALKAAASLVDPLKPSNWAGDALRRLLVSASRRPAV